MRAGIAFAALAGIAGIGQVAAQVSPASGPPATVAKADHPGRAIFKAQCASCHGAGPGDDGAPMLPGTMTLATKYKGELPGALELRADLEADTIRAFVRSGSGAMPMFRKSELSDAEIDAIAGYLKAAAAASGVASD